KTARNDLQVGDCSFLNALLQVRIICGGVMRSAGAGSDAASCRVGQQQRCQAYPILQRENLVLYRATQVRVDYEQRHTGLGHTDRDIRDGPAFPLYRAIAGKYVDIAIVFAGMDQQVCAYRTVTFLNRRWHGWLRDEALRIAGAAFAKARNRT